MFGTRETKLIVMLVMTSSASLLFFHRDSFAKPLCDRALAQHKITIAGTFWEQSKPVTVKSSRGKELPLTLSFDTEIPDLQIYTGIYQDPELFEKLKNLQIPPSDKDYIASSLKMTKSQFSAFALRRGVEKPDRPFQPTDLYPRFISSAINSIYSLQIRQAWVTNHLQGLPIDVGKDGGSVEIRHLSFEATPSAYKTLMEQLHTKIDNPQTHFHVGIPSELVSEDQLIAVARAMETRTILRVAMEDSDPVRSLSYSSTYMDDQNADAQVAHGARGAVRAQMDVFPGEVPAHDFELRQWSTTQQAMDEIEFVIKLVEHPEKIEIFKGVPNEHLDFLTQNLPGAILYAARVLAKSNSQHVLEVSAGLKNFSEQILTGRNLTVKLRKSIAQFLEQNHVLDLLSVETFQK